MDDLKTLWVWRNHYTGKGERKMKKLSSKVLKSLEEIMSKQNNVKLVSKDYDKKEYLKATLVYNIPRGDKEIGKLNISFFSGYVLGKGSAYFNTVRIELLTAERAKVNTKFIDSLESKFYSFSEEDKKKKKKKLFF